MTPTTLWMSDLMQFSRERCSVSSVEKATCWTRLALNSKTKPYNHHTWRCVAQLAGVSLNTRWRWNSHRPIDHICFAACAINRLATFVKPIIILRLFPQLTIRNCYITSCHAGQHRLARRPEQQGLARANAATNGAKQSRQPQPGRGLVGIQQMAPLEYTSDKQAYYSFIDPGRMKGWVGLVGWPAADGLPT